MSKRAALLLLPLLVSGCAENPLDKCISAKMAVWDEHNPSGSEIVKTCPTGSAFGCWTPEGKQDTQSVLEEWTRADAEADVTDKCLALTIRAT
jgi:hypothetical protein